MYKLYNTMYGEAVLICSFDTLAKAKFYAEWMVDIQIIWYESGNDVWVDNSSMEEFLIKLVK